MSDTWLFGYGSIMWKTGFEFEASEPCRVDGWARRFWQGSTDHRGTPEYPGRVVTLIPSPGEACFGLAYRLPAGRANTIIEELDYREKGGYDKVHLDLHLHSGTQVSGLTYIAHDHNPHYVGDAPLEQIAGHILKSTGPSGSNKEYILQLQQSLLQHDITDPHVEALARLVIEKGAINPMNIIEQLVADQPTMTQWRRDIHAHPEIAFKEHRTAALVAEKLTEFGINIETGIAGTGVVGTLTKGRGNRAIGLRADLDALPIQEANDFAHKSTHAGMMHACGHDGHTTMLLGAAKYLAEHGDFEGTVYFIFQPAEENEGGGRAMVEAGLFERYPMEAVYGMHNIPGMPVGTFAVKPGPMMAAFDIFELTVTGRGGHAAMPHLAIDPILVGTKIVEAYQSIVSRTIDPQDPVVLSVTQFHAGDAYNVIPNAVSISGCTRCFSPRVQAKLEQHMLQVAKDICAAHGASCEFKYERRYPPTINAELEANLAGQVAVDLVGADRVNLNPRPGMGSEDFAYMLQAKPGAYIWIGNGDGEGSCMVHNPGYDFNDEILPIGATWWVRLAETSLPPISG